MFTAGTLGDVQPLIGLGQALRRAGHLARIAADGQFRAHVVQAGLEFSPLSLDLRHVMVHDPGAMKDGLHLLRSMRRLRDCLAREAPAWVIEGREALRDTDLVIGCGMVTRLAMDLADQQGLPCVQAQLQPLAPSRELPPIGLRPPRRPWPGWFNLLLYRVLALLTWQMLRPACQEVRRQLGREPYPWWGPFFGREPGRERILFGFSELVVPRPGSWPRGHMATGYWTAEAETPHWRPSAQLQAFLQAGPPPVYIGFGSMCGHDAQTLTQVVLRAIALSGRRAVLARGWGGLAETAEATGDACNDVLWVDHVPHGWLLPQVAMAIHHGGAGTTAASLRAGVPSVVLPFFGDQPYWAGRLHDLGVAPPPLSRSRLSTAALMEAMNMAAADALRKRAAQLGQQLRAEQGGERAVEVLQQWALLSNLVRTPEARSPPGPTPRQPVSPVVG